MEQMTRDLKFDDSSSEVANSNSNMDASISDATSCISSTKDETKSVIESDIDHEFMAMDHGLIPTTAGYYGYYYPGYEGYVGGLGDQGYHVCSDGAKLQLPVMQADTGSLIYCMPGVQPGCTLYSCYLPVTMIGVEGQYIGLPAVDSPGYFTSPFSYEELVPASYLWDPSLFIGNGGYGGSLQLPGSKGSRQTSTFQGDELDKGYLPSVKCPYNKGKGGMHHPNRSVNYKANAGCWEEGHEKLQSRSRFNSITDYCLQKEKNHSSKTANAEGASLAYGNSIGSLAAERNRNSNGEITYAIRKDQYNSPEFHTRYDHAFFFVIKSYSEDDIHKSIKYNVWASTPNGNKKLDSAYQEAQARITEKVTRCPVFLFFSVNASGQFCGLAEMTGRVNFSKDMDFWQQNKWNGYFPVRWHIIKDIPNPQLRHIILENNDNKPVTNSRDTQELRFPQGFGMLNIFKNYAAKTSILDDFDFYENRQRVMLEKKSRLTKFHLDQHVDKSTAGLKSMDISIAHTTEEFPVNDNMKE
ncbi:YTH domain-containing protein ECT3-like isoform X2 [Tripterygium wilfordii]|nr:YTH domain-containing protein ECT3-like isoform X2 [Tripterygium wilfordii]